MIFPRFHITSQDYPHAIPLFQGILLSHFPREVRFNIPVTYPILPVDFSMKSPFFLPLLSLWMVAKSCSWQMVDIPLESHCFHIVIPISHSRVLCPFFIGMRILTFFPLKIHLPAGKQPHSHGKSLCY